MKESFRKLGLAGQIISDSEIQFTDQNPITHPYLKNSKLDIFNIGTLRNPKPLITTKTLERGQRTNNFNYQSFKLGSENPFYYSEYNSQVPFLGQISFFKSDKYSYSPENNDYFKPFHLNKDLYSIPGVDKDLSFSRFTYNSGISNSNTLNGYSNSFKGVYSQKTFIHENILTGEKIASVNKNFLKTGNYYLPYPNTLFANQFNKLNIPTKINPSYDTFSGIEEIDGLLVISTGNGVNSKICYISPHDYTTGFTNTVVYKAQPFTGKYLDTGTQKFVNSNIVQYRRIPSGIILPTLKLGSEYLSQKIKWTGIQFDESKNGLDDASLHKVLSNSELKQTTPIKDTYFYKLYSGLYNANKTFNTGTWNGIIPSGVNFSIEIIGFDLGRGKEYGVNNTLSVLYTGYSSEDALDKKIFNCLYTYGANIIPSEINKKAQVLDTKVLVDYDCSIKSTGRAYSEDIDSALIKSKINFRYNILNKISSIIKTHIPEIIYENRKFRKLKKFLTRS